MIIYNPNTSKKEEFIPLHEGVVNMYSCGPTVYNFFHIGNARPFIIFDTLRRYFEYRGYKVNFVQNFTDVDDKMINAAKKDGITVKQLGDKFIAEYFKDAQALNIKAATVHPKATEHIDDIIKLIEKLIENGHAYEVNGDVYFDVSSDPDYGKLTGQNLDDLEAGARIEVNDVKKHPYDFALWKAKKGDEISWKSPWGEGRPGWHIECSAMSMKYLGETIDIHGGGLDLKFPHHTNEIAQSENATGKKFVRYWMHNGYINIDNKKMSKSEGNFFTVRDIVSEFDPIAVRLFMLNAHYASPINFSKDLLQQAQNALSRISNCRQNLEYLSAESQCKPSSDCLGNLIASVKEKFNEQMDDDFNTAGAIGVVFDYIREINSLFADGANASDSSLALSALDELLDVLGLLRKEEAVPEEIISLAEQRIEARKNKDYAKADALRDEITSKGYSLKDTPDGYKISKS